MRHFAIRGIPIAACGISLLLLTGCAVVPPAGAQLENPSPVAAPPAGEPPTPPSAPAAAKPTASADPVASSGSPAPSSSQISSPTPVPPAAPKADNRRGRDLDQPFTVQGIMVVSKKHPVTKAFTPKRLTSQGLTPEAGQAASELIAAARKDGITIKIRSAYRSYATQKEVYERALRTYPSEAQAKRFNAAPGESEHQLGTSIDFWDGKLRGQGIAKTALGKWLWKHAREYGYILRYPDGREEITGYTFEPWHYRYIGIEDSMK
ncbi:MAG: M15 family metallopeptidase, partial [Propionibacteriaceae bacterium]|nr:M15 family metallopeptidase [Propionibacteriaceae bacterium]